MDLATSVLGKSIVDYLLDRQRSTVLQIGKDRFDRAALAGVACFNYQAAARLSAVVNTELQVKDTRDLYANVHPNRLAVRGLGAVCLAVLGAAFQARNVGGDAPLANWFRSHEIKTTFATVKKRDADERAKENKEIKRRKAARRNTAHTKRVERFTNRTTTEEKSAV